jgi:hypothetical protein
MQCPDCTLNPQCLKTPCSNTHIMLINAHYLKGAKCNTCLRPQNPRCLWEVNALFAYGYETIKLQRDIEYEISM